MAIYPVIMCGGSGVRLWPASRPGRPKQFTPLVGQYSSFQNTVRRVAGIEGAAEAVIVAGVGHGERLRSQLAGIGHSATLLLEPEARDSAAAMAAAAAFIAARDPQGVMVVVAADHHIPDEAAFRAAAATAARAALDGAIVTLGVKPSFPSTAYGYIRPGDAAGEVRPVLAFVEKPDEATAAAHVAAGYLWNSGNFVVRADRLLEELSAHAPAVRASVERAVAELTADGRLGQSFRAAPKISIDYAVMEKTARAAVLPVDFTWSDLGAWDAILAATDRDTQGNAVSGEAVLQDTQNCLIRNDSAAVVVAVGLRDLAVVAEADAILVTSLSASQQIKGAVETLKASGAPAADLPAAEDLAASAGRLNLWLTTAALPLWQVLGIDQDKGGFFEALEQDARPLIAPRRARVQPRQAYAYATAGASGWPGPWQAAAYFAMDLFERWYRRPDGLFRTLVGPDGEVLDDRAMVYDQAFALLAWSALGREEQALALLGSLSARRRRTGGFVEEGRHPFQSNPHMHLLEAAIGWIKAGGGSEWRALGQEVVDLALSRFIDGDSGALREYFDNQWRPDKIATRLEPGHQFEWAWLLWRWAELTGDGGAREAAQGLYATGLRGVDWNRGVVVDSLDGDITATGARLWPQSEWLKASLALGHGDDARQAVRALSGYLETPVRGLWRDKLRPDGGYVDEPAPASSLYHLVVAILELRAVSARPT
jgi:mannose-1-phosphate guanylyltransferase / mannose-6-phosphate isomerase